MPQFIVAYKLNGRQATARVAALDAKAARALFQMNNPRAVIVGVRRA